MKCVRMIGCLLVVLSVGACDKTREALGLNRKVTDEFETIDRKPLEIPPNYDVRPPRPGQKSSRERDGSEIAQAALGFSGVSGPVVPKEQTPGSERGLLAQVATKVQTDPGIRSRLGEAAVASNDDDLPQISLFSAAPKQKKQGKVIDPVAEQQRLERAFG